MKTRSKHFLLAAATYAFPLFLFAQFPHPSFKQYSAENGLPSSDVYQVKQDSKGYLWFATGNGVSRFNGYEFENFSTSNGLPDNIVFEIFEDNTGKIWFVTLSCKLSYYYKGQIHLFAYNDRLQKLLSNPVKTSFCVDDKGTVFIGIYQQGIYEISPSGSIKHYYDAVGNEPGFQLTEPKAGVFVFSRTANAGNNNLISINTPAIKTTLSFPGVFTRTKTTRFIRTRKNKIYFSYVDKLYSIDRDAIKEEHTFPNTINWIYVDKDDDLWVGTYLNGVFYIRNEDYLNKKKYLQDRTVDGILQDNEGGFWFTTENNSVYYTPSKHVLTFDMIAGLKDDNTNYLAAGANSILIGTRNGYVHQVSTSSARIITHDGSLINGTANEIKAIFYDTATKETWVSNDRGIAVFHGENQFSRILPAPGSGNKPVPGFYSYLLNDDGSYWLGHISGIRKVDHHHEAIPIAKDIKVSTMVKGTGNTILAGSVNGLWRIDLSDSSVHYLGDTNPLFRYRVMDLDYLRDTLLVIATNGAGILVYNNKAVRALRQQGSLIENVYSMYIDKDTIWAATNNGLHKIMISGFSPLTYTVKSFTMQDGLALNEIRDVIKLDNRIWLATNKGVSFFEETSLMKPSLPIPLYITGIFINDEERAPGDQLRLNYKQNTIRINFIGLGYKNAGKLQYRYRMSGIDSGWIYTRNREIQFTTLPTGEYLFQLDVMNEDGKWSGNEQHITFSIIAPYWKKTGFQLLCLFLLLCMIIAFMKNRFRNIQLEKEKNDSLNKTLLHLKLRALRAQMNPHFTFNVMNSIQHFIINREQEAAHRYLSKFSRLIRAILHNSQQDEVPLAEEIKALELYLELEAMRFEDGFDFLVNVDPAIDPNEIYIPSMLIQPYVENSVKHGFPVEGRKGLIEISILLKPGYLACSIKDNGKGRSVRDNEKHAFTHRSFGTSITRERLFAINELYNSAFSEKTIDLKDDQGHAAGTLVEIHIPFIKTPNNESNYSRR